MSILDKLKNLGGSQFQPKVKLEDYDKTTDRELLNLRRHKRELDEKKEKEHLKKAIHEENRKSDFKLSGTHFGNSMCGKQVNHFKGKSVFKGDVNGKRR
jgi:hypothetical protein